MKEQQRNPSALVPYFKEKINSYPLLKNVWDALAATEKAREQRANLIDHVSTRERDQAWDYVTTKMFDPAYKQVKDGKKEAFLPLTEIQKAVLEEQIKKFKADRRLEILDEGMGQLKAAYAMIRYHLLSQEPGDQETVSGEEFRLASEYITKRIFEQIIKNGKNFDFEHTILADPWRGGCAFSKTGKEAGIKHFSHLDVKRDEDTAEAKVKFESQPDIIDKKHPENNQNLKVIIADPMLATGGTMLDAIERYLKLGIKEENITLAAVVTAPEGVFRLLDKFSKIKIITGAHDENLNSAAYIEKGLGDFGDLYFRGLGDIYVNELVKLKILTEDQAIVLLNRMRNSVQGQPEKIAS